jgi:Domain of unknown function (DUF4352)
MLRPAFQLPAAALIAIWFTGCSQPTFPVRTYSMGEKVVLGHITYTVFETQWLNQAGTAPDLRIPQNRFFLVRMSANNSAGSDIIVPNVTVTDDKGTTYQELENGDGISQWIGFLRTVHPAEAASGNVLFDCPAGHYKLKLTDEDGERAALVDIPLNFTNETPEVPVPASDSKKKTGSDGHTLLPGGRN